MPFKMYFNTGVKPQNRPGVPLLPYEVWRGGVLQIEYYLESEPPEGWTLRHLADQVEPGELFIPIVEGGVLSKYAIFSAPFTPGRVVEDVDIYQICPGDIVILGGKETTVCQADIKHDPLIGRSLFGDTYRLGTQKVPRVKYTQFYKGNPIP